MSRHEQLLREQEPARHDEHEEHVDVEQEACVHVLGVSAGGGGCAWAGASCAAAVEGNASPTATTIPNVKRILTD